MNLLFELNEVDVNLLIVVYNIILGYAVLELRITDGYVTGKNSSNELVRNTSSKLYQNEITILCVYFMSLNPNYKLFSIIEILHN